jgi:hypothetical protein
MVVFAGAICPWLEDFTPKSIEVLSDEEKIKTGISSQNLSGNPAKSLKHDRAFGNQACKNKASKIWIRYSLFRSLPFWSVPYSSHCRG